ncbi:GTPase HflX [Candidatus Gracilibacteria bacterium]|nr:GTPase HflX [Candidatus Gracilibacteria bacterium]NUJ98925.1 GTPase HflX [Candidatus Gracilibacteria bacterium]
MAKSERELEQQQQKIEYSNKELKVFIADVIPFDCCKRENMDDRMLEMENLVHTYGGVVILKHIQKRGTPDYNTYIGEGKLDEIIEEMERFGAKILIFGNALKSHQMYKINEKLRKIGAKAWDRIDLILKIFEKNAKTIESRLQIELASIHHMGPRIFGMGMELSRQGGGSKLARGKGETNTEIMKRHLRKMEETIKKELEKYKKVRKEHRKHRERLGFFTVGIVGYTNAGKSSLLNTLTKKGVLSEDKLFATLGTSVGKLFIPYEEMKLDDIDTFQNLGNTGIEILLSDTIGFIRDLPPNLIEAFSSTLEDSIESDILLHVVDSTDTKIDEKMRVVEDILASIGANQKRLFVFNKIDLLSAEEIEVLKNKYSDINPIFVSSYKKKGFDDLKQAIISSLA